VKIRDLTKAHVKDYLTAKRAEGLSETTIKHHCRLLCLIGDALVDEALLTHNVVKRVKSPKATQSRANYIDEANQPKLLTCATQWLSEERNPIHVTTGMATYLALMTGMRRGEVCGLRWSDVVSRLDPKAKGERVEIRVQHAVENRAGTATLKEPKSKAGFRNIAIGTAVSEQLRRHRLWQRRYASWLSESLVDNDLVVPNDLGEILMPVVLSQRVTHFAKAAGVTAGLHTLRHTAISNWIRGGMNAKAVQERAGLSSITVTMDVYGHLFESLSADEIEALDARILDPRRGA
jgi:integrase